MVSPFDVLGVDVDADDDEIRRAYRERIKQVHPDQGGSLEEFQLVRRAYSQLTEDDRNGDRDEDLASVDLREEDAGMRATRVEFLDYEVVDDYGWSLTDPDLFEKAAEADLGETDYGRLLVEPTETLLEAAEGRGFTWPFSCRGGACANCAVYLAAGELSQPANTILPEELAERGFRLSCNGYPASDRLQIVFNLKTLPELDDLMLPPGPFRRAQSD
ncbi:ferredoxin Fer [Halorubrum vacuolatum]|uniref:Ferredoxin n=1 Tax=Halorubrum vacuolatum TaxID=63740 RepID=A0A238XSZ4_HALVU|nr:ferredoxin Fer [Halorubrum vacuolatum]SNR62166.1 Ferredoxin [Halorubrum vacuolatum]